MAERGVEKQPERRDTEAAAAPSGLSDEMLDRMIAANAAALQLPIPPAFAAGVRAELRALLEVGWQLRGSQERERPLVELAPVYRA